MARLVCPVCRNKLDLVARCYICKNKHSFDISKHGYVNLLMPNQKNSVDPGDSKEMSNARSQIMSLGYYSALSKEISALLCDKKCIVDAGCGEGAIVRDIVERFPDKEIVALDISKFAVEKACSLHKISDLKEIQYIVASNANIPLADKSTDIIINCFSKIFETEFFRIAKNDSIIIKVIPNTNHLLSLKKALYSDVYLNDITEEPIKGFRLLKEISVDDVFTAIGPNVKNLVMMTPYYHKTPPSSKAKVFAMPKLTTETSFLIRLYKKIKEV